MGLDAGAQIVQSLGESIPECRQLPPTVPRPQFLKEISHRCPTRTIADLWAVLFWFVVIVFRMT